MHNVKGLESLRALIKSFLINRRSIFFFSLLFILMDLGVSLIKNIINDKITPRPPSI